VSHPTVSRRHVSPANGAGPVGGVLAVDAGTKGVTRQWLKAVERPKAWG